MKNRFRNLGRAYGHEQLHVRNVLQYAGKINDELSKVEQSVGCVKPDECESAAKKAAADANGKLNKFKAGEREHTFNPTPAKETPYDPITPFPAKSDCSKPGKVKPFDKKKCP